MCHSHKHNTLNRCSKHETNKKVIHIIIDPKCANYFKQLQVRLMFFQFYFLLPYSLYFEMYKACVTSKQIQKTINGKLMKIRRCLASNIIVYDEPVIMTD